MFNQIRKSYKYRDYASIDSFSISELRKMCEILNQYCSETIGYKKNKGLPTFSVRKDYSGKNYGQYNPEAHKIDVYYNQVWNLKCFVCTFIHEYTHSIQNLRYYANRLKKIGYDNHPDEVEARNMERVHYRAAVSYLKKHL